jgi:hypothetical protein
VPAEARGDHPDVQVPEPAAGRASPSGQSPFGGREEDPRRLVEAGRPDEPGEELRQGAGEEAVLVRHPRESSSTRSRSSRLGGAERDSVTKTSYVPGDRGEVAVLAGERAEGEREHGGARRRPAAAGGRRRPRGERAPAGARPDRGLRPMPQPHAGSVPSPGSARRRPGRSGAANWLAIRRRGCARAMAPLAGIAPFTPRARATSRRARRRPGPRRSRTPARDELGDDTVEGLDQRGGLPLPRAAGAELEALFFEGPPARAQAHAARGPGSAAPRRGARRPRAAPA